MARRAIAFLLLASIAGAAPITRDKLDLIGNLWPRERRALYERLAGREDLAQALLEEGIDPLVVRELEALEPGPLALERYAHAQVLATPDLTARQRALLGHLVPSVEAAQLALEAHARRLLAGMRDQEGQPLYRRIQESHQRQIRDIERRFWRVVSLALDVAQRAALLKRLPPPYQPIPAPGHVYLLEDLTPSQATRVRALQEEYQSENAADAGELQRLRAAGAPAAEITAVTDRIADRLRAALERARTIFTPEQAARLSALLPFVTPADRKRHPGEMLPAMRPRPEQMERLKALGARIEERARAAQAEAKRKLAGLEGEIGPDAPQAMMMQMAHSGAEAARVAAFEEAGREALLEILEPAQILRWVVTPE